MTKTWLITGSSRGFGYELAKAVPATGDNLVATARRPEQLDDLLAGHADRARAAALDVTDVEAARAAVAVALDEFGGLDVVVNNAGYANSAPIEETSEEDFRAQIETNLFGVVNVTKAALPVLRQRRSGHFIQFSSIGGRVGGTPGVAAYQTAKFGVEGFSEALAAEVKPFGVKVTIIEPGAFRTDWQGSSMRRSEVGADYEQTVGVMNRRRAETDGKQPGDPARAAGIILEIVGMDEPPLRLLWGAGAVTAAQAASRARAAEAEQWADINRSADSRPITEQRVWAAPAWYLLWVRRFEKIDVGYELTASITSGDSAVPVVYVNALGTSQDQWDQVLPGLYRHTTVTYDRPGIGSSDPLPPHLADQPRAFGALADELRSMLDQLAIESPHVVVGHSMGALIAMMYAARHGAHTAGLVLVDGTTLQHLVDARWPTHEGGDDNPGSSMLDLPGSIAELDAAVWTSVPAAVLASAPGRWTRLTPDDAAEYAPLTLEQLDQRWQDGQRLLAEKLDALLVVADWAGHHVATDQPELVAACVSAVIAAARIQRPVTIPLAQLRYAGGSCPAF